MQNLDLPLNTDSLELGKLDHKWNHIELRADSVLQAKLQTQWNCKLR